MLSSKSSSVEKCCKLSARVKMLLTMLGKYRKKIYIDLYRFFSCWFRRKCEDKLQFDLGHLLYLNPTCCLICELKNQLHMKIKIIFLESTFFWKKEPKHVHHYALRTLIMTIIQCPGFNIVFTLNLRLCKYASYWIDMRFMKLLLHIIVCRCEAAHSLLVILLLVNILRHN